jgi:hypothetical protein
MDCVELHMPHPEAETVKIYTEEKVERMIDNFIRFYKLHPNEEIKEYAIRRYEGVPGMFRNEERLARLKNGCALLQND